MTAQSNSLLIDVKAACQLLSISRAAYFTMRSGGRIGPTEIKLGKKLLLRTEEVQDWVAAGCPPRRLWNWGKE